MASRDLASTESGVGGEEATTTRVGGFGEVTSTRGREITSEAGEEEVVEEDTAGEAVLEETGEEEKVAEEPGTQGDADADKEDADGDTDGNEEDADAQPRKQSTSLSV